MEGEKLTQTMVLKRYFGLKEGQKLGEFATELKALSPEAKKELAEAAAKELGVEIASI